MSSDCAVTFISADGETRWQGQGKAGSRLLDLAHALDVPLEGACEGAMACSTCHVIVDTAWADRLRPPSEEEADMLDFAYGVCRTSRLACQIDLAPALDGLIVSLPRAARNMLGR